ncbi:MAG: DUF234 domain-containing protein [Candidatus Bathyarchaeia archaeon]
MWKVTEPEAKRGLYKIRDPFFSFWFGFIRPNKRQLELGLEKNVWEGVRESLMGIKGGYLKKFLEVLVKMAKRNLLPIQVEKIGKWWRKEIEIDLVGLKRKERRALAVEAKWTELDYQEAKRLLSKLTAKAQQIRDVKETIVRIIAKKIVNKEKTRNEGFIALDLQDIGDLSRCQLLHD